MGGRGKQGRPSDVLVHVEKAPGTPYDHGRLEIVEEPWPEGVAVSQP